MTSGTPSDVALDIQQAYVDYQRAIADAEAQGIVTPNIQAEVAPPRSQVIYTTWTIVDGNAYKYSSHTSRAKAKRVAGDIKGVVTQEDMIMDFR